jgi:hypothetical protein
MDVFLLPFIFLIQAAISFLLLFQALLQAFSSRRNLIWYMRLLLKITQQGIQQLIQWIGFILLFVCFKLLQTFLAADSTLDIHCSHYIHHILSIRL